MCIVNTHLAVQTRKYLLQKITLAGFTVKFTREKQSNICDAFWGYKEVVTFSKPHVKKDYY